MPSRNKIDLQKVLACMNTKCPRCAHEIEPGKIRRVSSEKWSVRPVAPGSSRTNLPSDAANLHETRIIGTRQSAFRRSQLYQTDPWLDCSFAFSTSILSCSRIASTRNSLFSCSASSASEWLLFIAVASLLLLDHFNLSTESFSPSRD